jgi:SET domain-containing protein
MPPEADERTVEVRASPIQGLGVYAVRAFEAGERIRRVNIVREITKAAPLRPELGEFVYHCAYPSGKMVLWGPPDRHYNHSCDPNAYQRELGDGREEVYIVARRPIAEGEEITVDYIVNTAGGNTWPCNCGSARCRGETVGDYFKLPLEVQIEYLPELADWFVAAHREQVEALRRQADSTDR